MYMALYWRLVWSKILSVIWRLMELTEEKKENCNWPKREFNMQKYLYILLLRVKI